MINENRSDDGRGPHSRVDDLDRRVEYLLSEQSRLESRLNRLEESFIFRNLRRIGIFFDAHKRRLGQALLRSSLHPIYLRLLKPKGPDEQYKAWVRLKEAQLPSTERLAERAGTWKRQPKISILMPVHNPVRQWLREAVDSVRDQSYGNWQLCICDDASAETWVEPWIKSAASADSRIKFFISPKPVGISGALNLAGQFADGDFVAFLDHDDILHPMALHYVAEQLQDSKVGVVYTDEDHLDESGSRVRPQFKPEWSPELLNCCMYLGHLLVVARKLIEEAGWFRTECDGSQDHDLALRLTDLKIDVRHVPLVLYHWRQHPASTSANPKAKPYARTAAAKALNDALARRGAQGEVQDGPIPHTFFVRLNLTHPEKVSIIICSRSARLLEKCLEALQLSTDYQNREVVVVLHTTDADGNLESVAARFGCCSVLYDGRFDFAKMNNLGAAKASAPFLLFLNDDTAPLRRDWLHHVVSHLQRPEIGVVGGKLVFPTGAIQHAGIAIGMMDGVGHPGRRLFASDFYPWLDLTRDVSAVTGACLGIRRELFEKLSGFNLHFPVNYNDVDLCLRVRQAGLRVICEPRVLLTHTESASRNHGTSFGERWLFQERWGSVLLDPDPYFPAVFDYNAEDIRLAI